MVVGEFDSEMLASATGFIRDAETIAISGHTNPDGDALGSALGLAAAIEHTYPDKRVIRLLADESPVPRIYRFLPGADALVPATSYEETPGLMITVDTPTLERLRHSADVVKRAKTSICLDHHPHRESFADIDITVTKAAATGLLVWKLLRPLSLKHTPDVATNLMCALITDTGRFQYQSVDQDAFLVASQLSMAGAHASEIAHHVYQSRRIESIRLESIVLSRIELESDGRVGWSYVTEEDFERTGAVKAESDGLIDIVRSIDGVEVAMLAREEKCRGYRCSLRSKTHVDVSTVAERFGGGGHKAAAGLTFDGTFEEVRSKLIPELERALEQGETRS